MQVPDFSQYCIFGMILAEPEGPSTTPTTTAMTLLKKFALAALLATAAAGAANAGTVLADWIFNPLGGGYESGQMVNEWLDVNGNSFIQASAAGGNGFSFREHAVFNVVQADSNGRLFPITFPGGNLTGTFDASGVGQYGGSINYTGGTLRLYQNPVNHQYGTEAGYYGANLGREIARFEVYGGGGRVDAQGMAINSGQLLLLAAPVGGLDERYFALADGARLSPNTRLALSFTNANTIASPSATLVNEVACQFAGFTGPGCGGGDFANDPGNYFVSSNGQFRLVDIPEPGSLALFGIAMLGVAAARRKRA